jgi:hypothetical protein
MEISIAFVDHILHWPSFKRRAEYGPKVHDSRSQTNAKKDKLYGIRYAILPLAVDVVFRHVLRLFYFIQVSYLELSQGLKYRFDRLIHTNSFL